MLFMLFIFMLVFSCGGLLVIISDVVNNEIVFDIGVVLMGLSVIIAIIAMIMSYLLTNYGGC